MSGLSDQLQSARPGAVPVGGETWATGTVGLGIPEYWAREFVHQGEAQLFARDGLTLLTQNDTSHSSLSAVVSGVHPHQRPLHSLSWQRPTDMTAERHALEDALQNMQTHLDPDVHMQAYQHVHMDGFGNLDIDAQLTKSFTSEDMHAGAPQPLSLALGNHSVSANQPRPVGEKDSSSTLCPVPALPSTDSSSLPVEMEKKYALRSSGRPRFRCHLRKSSRLRRGVDNNDKKEEDQGKKEAKGTLDEKVWQSKEDVAVANETEHPSTDAVVPTPPCLTDVPVPLPVPKPVPKALPKPGPRLGHRPGPKSRCRPSVKPGHKAGPKSVMRRRQAAQAAQALYQQTAAAAVAASHLFEPPVSASPLTTKDVVCTLPSSGSRRGRFLGIRKIVVKVPRIPVSLSRRQKSYKISNVETVTGAEKSVDSSLEGSEPVREPTALLRMKNNGKSVMVMFPPGELPVILKRRRGRPPKQPLPGIQVEPPVAGCPGVSVEQPKKPRRRRRTKLPLPYPSYVNDTNDVKIDYGDVLSKLAFLNRQPPATGRCSPPRCWTPSEPESFHVPLENPGISTLLHRLTGCRRPRGGRGGGLGRGAGLAGRTGGSECNKSTFSDFFESIGKKRKLSPMSEHGLPRKRGKGGGAGGVGRGGGMVGTELGVEKVVRKRRARKNGVFKGGGMTTAQDWPNGGWGEEEMMLKEKGLGGFQLSRSPRVGFSSCEMGLGGADSSPGGVRGLSLSREDSQGLFAGYFRSLLDSDDSSDLLDISASRSASQKPSSTPSFEPSSPAGAGHSWSPAFLKWSAKGANSVLEGSAQAHCSTSRTAHNLGNLSQTSPTSSIYSKSTPPSLSHSPSSPHPASYGTYPSGYSCTSPAVPQRSSDCSYVYSSKTPSVGPTAYSSYHAATKRSYGGFPLASHSPFGRGESTGPTSPGGAGFMSVSKGNPFTSCSPEAFRQFNSSQWSYRHGGWPLDSFGSQYPGYGEYGSNESKDILDISNYTPQKAKRPPFPESLSESSSDSLHLGPTVVSGGANNPAPAYKQSEAMPAGGDKGQSSLSSLEKLMMDWHDSASGPSYSWSQNVLFQGGGTGKPGRGRRKRTETLLERETGLSLHSDCPSSPSPTPTPGLKRGGGGRGRGSRGGRGGLSPCQRERPSVSKVRGKAASSSGMGAVVTAAGPEPSGLFHEGLDCYSGDSSSLSPLATNNPAPPSSYLQEPCEYPSPYSAHPSTPSSEERYPTLYPGESCSSLSPSVSSPPYPPKPTPPPQSYHLASSRTFSPSCSPSPRLTPHCSTALSPSNRPPPKELQFSQYDSPSYCSSPYWYGQTSHSSSPNPHSNSVAMHTHNSLHTSPHGNAHTTPHASAVPNMQTQLTPNESHHGPQPHTNLSAHTNSQLHNNFLTPSNSQPHLNMHHPAHSHSNLSPILHSHSTSGLYEERSPPSALTANKRDLMPLAMTPAHCQAPLPLCPYPKAPLDSSPHQEDASGFSLPQQSYQGVGHRYPSQVAQGGGVLCQLLDTAGDDSFSVTTL